MVAFFEPSVILKTIIESSPYIVTTFLELMDSDIRRDVSRGLEDIESNNEVAFSGVDLPLAGDIDNSENDIQKYQSHIKDEVIKTVGFISIGQTCRQYILFSISFTIIIYLIKVIDIYTSEVGSKTLRVIALLLLVGVASFYLIYWYKRANSYFKQINHDEMFWENADSRIFNFSRADYFIITSNIVPILTIILSNLFINNPGFMLVIPFPLL